MRNLIFLITFFTISTIKAQEKISIEDINTFIEENSSPKKNFWTHLEVKDHKLIVFNQSRKSLYRKKRPKNGTLTFIIDKINTKKIKGKKEGLVLSPNEKGNFATYYFNREKKVEKIFIQTNDMSKDNKNQLISMLGDFINSYDKKDYDFLTKSNLHKNKRINSMISSLFLNYELTRKNGEIKILFPFVYKMNESNILNITSSLNLTGEENELLLHYDEKGSLKKIDYSKSSAKENVVNFKYDLIYEDSFLKSVKINGVEKYVLEYKDGLVDYVSIKRNKDIYRYGVEIHHNVAYLKLDIIEDGVYKASNLFINKGIDGMSKDKIDWNRDFQISSFSFDIFKSKNIVYDNYSNIVSLNFSDVHSYENELKLDYSYDKKNNWITSKELSKNFEINRKIVYKN